ncbi:stage II sporulation protein M [Algivirga pacifica]|uniref:Stage II sporulation protein M n=1 Tax=Algivirga pacifica TaxID=1162670 RepID=A0ABP9DEQ7_9BACT
MREKDFILQNEEKWKEFEQLLESSEKDPERLSDLFLQSTNDLAYSQTFYERRSVKTYLNTLSQKVYTHIYQSQSFSFQELFRFWKYTLPSISYRYRKVYFLSFLIFVLAMGVGVMASMQEEGFARIVLGDNYIVMTNANIEKGDPMAVYKQRGPFNMFLGITLNNVMVAVRTYLSGFLLGIGTLFIMFYNGIMVGAFQYFFIEKGLFWESFLTIWQHGTIEISSIVLAGAAGLVLARGIIFPGTYSRAYAFRMSAKESLMIISGLVPLFIIAGFIEGYFTRFTEVSDIVRLFSILLSLGFILGYFVFYPAYLSKKGLLQEVEVQELHSEQETIINYEMAKSSMGVFADTIRLCKKYFGYCSKYIALIAIGSTITYLLYEYFYLEIESLRLFYLEHLIPVYFDTLHWGHVLLQSVWTTVALLLPIHLVSREQKANRKGWYWNVLLVYGIAYAFNFFIETEESLIAYLIICFPFALMIQSALWFSEGVTIKKLKHAVVLCKQDVFSLLMLSIVFLGGVSLIGLFLKVMVYENLLPMLMQAVVDKNDIVSVITVRFVNIFLKDLVLYAYCFVSLLGYSVAYFSTLEKVEAVALEKRIDQVLNNG